MCRFFSEPMAMDRNVIQTISSSDTSWDHIMLPLNRFRATTWALTMATMAISTYFEYSNNILKIISNKPTKISLNFFIYSTSLLHGKPLVQLLPHGAFRRFLSGEQSVGQDSLVKQHAVPGYDPVSPLLSLSEKLRL